MDQNIERRQFVCPKCGCNSYEHDQFQATGGNFAKIFDIQNKKFITIRDILLNTHAVANLIRTRKEPQIISIQETQLPMKTLEMAVRDVKAQYGTQHQLHTLLDQQLS